MTKKLEELVSILNEKLGDEYEVSITETEKPGRKMTGILITDKKVGVGVTIDAETLPEEQSLDDVGNNIVSFAKDVYGYHVKYSDMIALTAGQWENAKRYLSACVCPYEANQCFLQDKAWYKYLDLAVYFCLSIPVEEDICRLVITEKIKDAWGITVEELKRVSEENFPEERIQVFKFGLSAPESTDFRTEKERGFSLEEDSLYSLSYFDEQYEMCDYGGSIIARADILNQIAEGLGKDFLIIPYSRDNIVISANEKIDRRLFEIHSAEIKEDNEKNFLCHGEQHMILSDHAYIYSRKEKRVLEESDLDSYFNNN